MRYRIFDKVFENLGFIKRIAHMNRALQMGKDIFCFGAGNVFFKAQFFKILLKPCDLGFVNQGNLRAFFFVFAFPYQRIGQAGDGAALLHIIIFYRTGKLQKRNQAFLRV